jgi:elongation factor Ts
MMLEMVTTVMIKQLKEASGAGILDCKRALDAAGGDMQQAADALREQGLARATRKAGRETGAGLVVVQATADAVCAVELDCETDFAAGTDAFRNLTHRIADQVLADVRMDDAGQTSAAAFIDAPGKTTATVIQELVGKLGENIVLRQVARYASDGMTIVEGYIHAGDVEAGYGPGEGRIGVLVELGVDDSAAIDQTKVKKLARNIALQIAFAQRREESVDDGNPISAERWLLEQPYVRDEHMTVGQLIDRESSEAGGPISLRRFARFEIQN